MGRGFIEIASSFCWFAFWNPLKSSLLLFSRALICPQGPASLAHLYLTMLSASTALIFTSTRQVSSCFLPQDLAWTLLFLSLSLCVFLFLSLCLWLSASLTLSLSVSLSLSFLSIYLSLSLSLSHAFKPPSLLSELIVVKQISSRA